MLIEFCWSVTSARARPRAQHSPIVLDSAYHVINQLLNYSTTQLLQATANLTDIWMQALSTITKSMTMPMSLYGMSTLIFLTYAYVQNTSRWAFLPPVSFPSSTHQHWCHQQYDPSQQCLMFSITSSTSTVFRNQTPYISQYQ